MATQSYIVRKEDNGYAGVYCHWDGYPEHNGRILLEHYSEPSKLRKLIALGNISVLDADIGEAHSFGDRPEGITTFYGRDRGDPDCQPRRYSTLEALMEWLADSGCEFVYVYDGFWQYAERGAQYFGLSDGTPFSEFKPLWSAFTSAAQS